MDEKSFQELKNRSLYARLKRLFSNDVIVRNVGGKKLKVIDTDDIFYTTDRNSLRDRFNRLRTTGYNNYTRDFNLSYQSSRVELFRDYDCMDMDPILSSALDIYADECTTRNEMGDVITVRSTNDDIKSILHNLFYDILNIEFNLWPWTRSLVKYGDFYLRLHISPEYGVYMVEPLSSYYVTRVENSDLENRSFVKFQVNLPYGNKIDDLDNYQMAHFRLLSDSNFLPYGKCLVSETHVDTEYGSRYIKDLIVGEKVWSFNINSGEFELTNVRNKINSGVKDIIKVRTRHNFIESSKNHPILIFNTNTKVLEYKQASDIKIGDLLIINSNENKKFKISNIIKELNGFNKNGWKNNINNIPDDVDSEFSELIGFMIGDGWLSGENSRVSFATGPDDSQNKYYANILEKYSGKSGSWRMPTKNSGGQFQVNSKMLAAVLFNNGLVGKAKTKRIPDWVFNSSKEIQLSFIRGLTNADAWSFDDGFANRYSISLCNKDLIYDFKRLLQMNNIKSSIPVEDDSTTEVTICGVDCIKHGEYSINYYLEGDEKTQLKKYDYLKNKNILLEPVVGIEFMGEKETWDIQVDSDNSNFVANGLVVHNSTLEGARRVWKQLSLMEDAMLIHRIMRAPEKRIFKVDIGNIPPNEVDNHMERIIQQMKKTPYLDQNTGDYNLRFNLQNMVEDFFLPVRGSDSGTSIDNLPGLEWTGTEDIEYLRNKMMAALKIPKAFLGYDETLCVSPDTKIPLLNGIEKMVKELIDDYNNGIKNYVYSIDEITKNIVPGEIEWAGFTRKNADVVRVWLDNNKYIDCTPDHKFMTRNGEWVEAINLSPDQPLMPLYTKNHRVVRVEMLQDKIDTCDITIKKYHNFATSAGVIIHNSGKATLAAEDIRFARTIQRVQRIIVSELNKIAVVHLYSQGFRDAALVDFSLELTNPSTIFEKEKIDVWKSKIEVCKDMSDQKMFSKKWMYENVFGLSDQDMIMLQKQLVDDAKGTYRFKQIEDEGNDPALEFLKVKDGGGGDSSGTGDVGGDTGESVGSETGGGTEGGTEPKTGSEAEGSVGGGTEPKLTERDQTGRKDARKYPFGEDPLGTLELNSRSDLSPTHKYRNKSPLSLESLKSLSALMSTVENPKEVLREGGIKSYMDDTNIKE